MTALISTADAFAALAWAVCACALMMMTTKIMTDPHPGPELARAT